MKEGQRSPGRLRGSKGEYMICNVTMSVYKQCGQG